MLSLNHSFFKRRPRREYLYDHYRPRPSFLLVWLRRLILFSLLITLGMLIMFLISPAQAAAAERADESISMNDVSHGSLLVKTSSPGQYSQIPLLDTRVEMDISGMIARSHVKQFFKNTSQQWLEAIYVFPLPETAAVDHLRMRIGERIIEGQIKEKQQARKIYQQARKQGKKTALLEQQRANLFTTSLANIAPGESIMIEIEYQQSLNYDQGTFSLRFPMAITPRYIPGTPLRQNISVSGSGWAKNTDQVRDASFISPPLNPQASPINPVSLDIKLDAGFPLRKITSPYHAIRQQQMPDGHYVIQLADTKVASDRDFELRWTPDIGHAPRAALFSEKIDQDYYHLLMVLPPENQAHNEQPLAREVIYVIDTSGSMYGTSMQQAKQSLIMALDRLRLHDYFNIIQFNSTTQQLFSHSRPASFENILAAKEYSQQLEADGGTEMAPALKRALSPAVDSNRVRQVIFITDGSVGNESALFDIIHKNLSQSRLFTIGIGSAPNSYFMRKAAQYGRGSFTYIGDINEVSHKMNRLFKKLENPLMTDLQITFDRALQVDMWPRRIADLYSGEALLLALKTDRPLHQVRLEGKRALSPWQATLNFQATKNSPGMGTYWARNKIASLMDSRHRGASQSTLRQQIIELALRHHLVSKYTSLVAVDISPSRPTESPLQKKALPVNLPRGQHAGKIVAHLPQTATPAQLQLLIGITLLLLALLGQLFFFPSTTAGQGK